MRRFVTFVALISALLCSSAAEGQTFTGGEIFQIGNSDLYWAAVKTDYFREHVARQRSDNWCWAACIQMVLNYQGVNVTQEQIVENVFGSQIDRPAAADVIAQAANGWRAKGHTIQARVENPYYTSAESFINDLVEKYPLIIGLSMPGQNVGHAYVLTGVSFRVFNGQYYPVEVILRDPWPSNQSRIKLSWDDFSSRCHTIVHIYPV